LGDVLLAVEDRSGVRRGDDGVVPTPDDDDIVADDFVSLYTDAVVANLRRATKSPARTVEGRCAGGASSSS
jgi:hypothetical protein